MNEHGRTFDAASEATRRDLETIVSTLLELLPGDARPLSVVFSGGFARNESGHYSCGDRALPFGDYDLDVILPRPLLDSEREPIDRRLEEVLAYRSVDSDSEPTLVEDAEVHNVLDLRFKTAEEFHRRAPDLALYDLLRSYRILHGEDLVAGHISLDLDEVSVFSPWRILGNRLVLGLKHFDTDYRERPPTVHEALAFRLAVCRIYLDLAGLICFLHGDYRTGSAERLEALGNNRGIWRSWIPDADLFLERVQVARSFKSNPVLERVDAAKVFSEWFDLLYDVGRVLPHLINLVLLSRRIPISKLAETLNRAGVQGKQAGVVRDPFREDWRKLVAQQVRLYPSLYFKDFIAGYLRRKGRNLPMETFLCGQASRYYGAMENYLWKGRNWIFKNLRRATLAPTSFQSAALPLILFSYSPTGEVDLKALEMFDSLMNPYMLMPFDFLGPEKRWEATKRCFVHEMLDYRAQR